MELIDFAEKQGQRAAAFSLEGMEIMNRRSGTLLAMLVAGAGAAGSYALGQIARPDGIWALCTLGAASVWWFALAALLAWRPLQSREVRAQARSGLALLEQAKKYDDYIKQEALEGEAVSDTLTLLREMELRLQDDAIQDYRAASTAAALALDRVYRGAACTPVVVGLGLVLAKYLS